MIPFSARQIPYPFFETLFFALLFSLYTLFDPTSCIFDSFDVHNAARCALNECLIEPWECVLGRLRGYWSGFTLSKLPRFDMSSQVLPSRVLKLCPRPAYCVLLRPIASTHH